MTNMKGCFPISSYFTNYEFPNHEFRSFFIYFCFIQIEELYGILEFGSYVINSSVDFLSYFLLTSVRYISLINNCKTKKWQCIRGAKSGQKSKVYKVFGKETRKSKLSKLPNTSDFLSIYCITDVVKSLSTVQTKVQPFACNKMSMSH